MVCLGTHLIKNPTAALMRINLTLFATGKIVCVVSQLNRDQEVTAWQENPTVESLLFSKETCLHLILLLIQSTNTIAPSLREVNGFKVHQQLPLLYFRINSSM